jgi:XTP/dITP diphosphohydrolase
MGHSYIKTRSIQRAVEVLGTYYKKRLDNFLKDKRDIFIGSTNPGKVTDWRTYLGGDYIVSSPCDTDVHIVVEECMTSLRENAERKALQWAKASGKLTISDDTGFYIHALGGAPGVSVKRWGGKFTKELSNSELLEHVREQLKGITDTSAHFETVYSIATPDGRVFSIPFENHGYIDTSLFDAAAEQGYPLSAVFKASGRDKTWAQMTPQERTAWDEPIVAEVKRIIALLNPTDV